MTSPAEAIGRQRKVDAMFAQLVAVDMVDADLLAEASEDLWHSLADAAEVRFPSLATRAALIETVRHHQEPVA
jgi:hypothetical protein